MNVRSSARSSRATSWRSESPWKRTSRERIDSAERAPSADYNAAEAVSTLRKPDPSVRIAVTGAGIICSIGRNKAEVWKAIEESRAGIRKLTRFPGETFPTDLAAEVDGEIESMLPISRREAKRMSRSDKLAIIAAAEAIQQAGAPLDRAIVSTGTSTGGLLEGEEFFFRRVVRGDASASRVLQQPTSGGSDALARLTYSGFNVLQAVDAQPCTPFAAHRKGITLGEGAAYLVLERWDDAIARGARPIAELRGYGATCDAHHPTAPHEEGRGAEAAMRGALFDARWNGDRLDYINAHGTGTLLNDSAETKAIISAIGTEVPVSSTKSYFGHTLGASGAVEAVITILALLHQIAPPTLRLDAAAAECTLDYIPHTPRPMAMENALSNTFGFGGSNVSLLFRKA